MCTIGPSEERTLWIGSTQTPSPLLPCSLMPPYSADVWGIFEQQDLEDTQSLSYISRVIVTADKWRPGEKPWVASVGQPLLRSLDLAVRTGDKEQLSRAKVNSRRRMGPGREGFNVYTTSPTTMSGSLEEGMKLYIAHSTTPPHPPTHPLSHSTWRWTQVLQACVEKLKSSFHPAWKLLQLPLSSALHRSSTGSWTHDWRQPPHPYPL